MTITKQAPPTDGSNEIHIHITLTVLPGGRRQIEIKSSPGQTLESLLGILELAKLGFVQDTLLPIADGGAAEPEAVK